MPSTIVRYRRPLLWTAFVGAAGLALLALWFTLRGESLGLMFWGVIVGILVNSGSQLVVEKLSPRTFAAVNLFSLAILILVVWSLLADWPFVG